MDDNELSQPIAKRPPKPHQVRRAYQKRGCKPRMLETERRRLDREFELDRRAKEIRAKEKRRKELEQKRKQKEEEERQRRRKLAQGEAPVKARSSQQTLPRFLDTRVKQPLIPQIRNNLSSAQAITRSAQTYGTLTATTSESECQSSGRMSLDSELKTFDPSEVGVPAETPNHESQAAQQLQTCLKSTDMHSKSNQKRREPHESGPERLRAIVDTQYTQEARKRARTEEMEGANQAVNIQVGEGLMRFGDENPAASHSPRICRYNNCFALASRSTMSDGAERGDPFCTKNPPFQAQCKLESTNDSFAIPAKGKVITITNSHLLSDTSRPSSTRSSSGTATTRNMSQKGTPYSPVNSKMASSFKEPRNYSLPAKKEITGATTSMSNESLNPSAAAEVARDALGDNTFSKECGSIFSVAENSQLRVQTQQSAESSEMVHSSSNIGICNLTSQPALHNSQISGPLPTKSGKRGANREGSRGRSKQTTNGIAVGPPLMDINHKANKKSVELTTMSPELAAIHHYLEDFLESNTQIQRDIEQPITGPCSTAAPCCIRSSTPAGQSFQHENTVEASLELHNREGASGSGFRAICHGQSLIDTGLLDISTQELNDYGSSSSVFLSPNTKLERKSPIGPPKQRKTCQAATRAGNSFDGGLSDDEWAAIDPDALIKLHGKQNDRVVA